MTNDGRRSVLALLALGYGASMMAFRPTVMLTLPSQMAELGQPVQAGGAVVSWCQLSYMLAKPLLLVVSDWCDPRRLLLCSLWLTTGCVAALPVARAPWQLAGLYVLLMVAQAPHGPAVSRLLVYWYKPAERGLALSIVNATVNVASCGIPVVISWALALGSWRWLYGAIAALMLGTTVVISAGLPGTPGLSHPSQPFSASSLVQTLASRALWLVAVAMALLYAVRLGFEAWVQQLIAARTVGGLAADPATVATVLVLWNAGGLVGTVLAGSLSDWSDGRVAEVGLLYALGLCAGTGALHCSSGLEAVAGVAGLIGACIYGLRTLLTLQARGAVPAEAGGVGEALVSCFGELGGAAGGLPLVMLVDWAGSWRVYTMALAGLASLMLCCLTVCAIVTRTARANADHIKAKGDKSD